MVRSTSPCVNRQRSTVVIFALLLLELQVTVLCGPVAPSSPRRRTSRNREESNEVALGELSRVFGVGHVSDYYRGTEDSAAGPSSHRHHHHHHHRHRSPPEYMTELYSTVAYADGISKTASPYEADVVRGIPDGGMYTRLMLIGVVS